MNCPSFVILIHVLLADLTRPVTANRLPHPWALTCGAHPPPAQLVYRPLDSLDLRRSRAQARGRPPKHVNSLRSEVSANPYPWTAPFAEVSVPVPAPREFGCSAGKSDDHGGVQVVEYSKGRAGYIYAPGLLAFKAHTC